MGGWVSTFRTNPEDNEQKIKKYDKEVENNPYGYGLADTDDLKEIKWWQRLIFDLRFRIAYALIIGIIVGIAVPIAIYFMWFNNSDSTIYGSCLIKADARFQCLINNVEPADRSSCVSAMCCWEENDSRPFKCFHSFPSAYQYRVTNVDDNVGNGTNPRDRVQLDIAPNHPESMKILRIWINWIDESHLNLQIFSPSDGSRREMGDSLIIGTSGIVDRNGLLIHYGDVEGYFFIKLVRISEDRNETIFDTRLGPLNSWDEFITFSTILPTPYFYGLKGGEGIASKGTVTYGVVNGFENSELPFYMSLEETNLWHGVLLDTSLPFLTQVLQAPGIAFHIEGSKGRPAEVNLHLFTGPTQSDVLHQLHSHLSGKLEGEIGLSPLPYIPPYWALGLHLCRKSANGSMALEHIKQLNEIYMDGGIEVRRIPYDSDCIDEDLRNPFGIDHQHFPSEDVESITDFLISNATKKIVLTQKVVIPYNATMIEGISEYLVMDNTENTNQSGIRPFAGMIGNLTVFYPDVLHPHIFEDLTLWEFNFGQIPLSGLVLLDNFPKNERAIDLCQKPTTFLQKLLLQNSSVTGSEETTSWGSICAGNITHKVGPSINGSFTEKTHLEVHNIYGLEALKKFRQIGMMERPNETLLLSSSSGWTESLYFGGYNGMPVAFSWIGLRESLAHILGQFLLSPFSGTPICGSFFVAESPVQDNNLCLRWYQVALLLPYAYHSYTHGNISRGPLDFPQRYQDYLKEAIRQRYTYAPYYYTLLISYQQAFVPMVLPMSYEFHTSENSSTIFKLVDQFMIGSSLLASPIVKPDLNRETYFPLGKWYDSDGYVAWNDTSKGGFKIVTGHIIQTPLFIRGGHIIPTLQNPMGNSILESRNGNYTLLVALLLSPENATQFGEGLLHADNGEMNSVSPVFSTISFSFSSRYDSNAEVDINLSISAGETELTCGNSSVSTTIDQIKYLGFPINFNNVTVTVVFDGNEISHEVQYRLGDEMDYLRVYGIDMNWCEIQDAEIHVIAHK